MLFEDFQHPPDTRSLVRRKQLHSVLPYALRKLEYFLRDFELPEPLSPIHYLDRIAHPSMEDAHH